MQIYIQSMPTYCKSRWQVSLGSGRWRSFKLDTSAAKHVKELIEKGHAINEPEAWARLQKQSDGVS